MGKKIVKQSMHCVGPTNNHDDAGWTHAAGCVKYHPTSRRDALENLRYCRIDGHGPPTGIRVLLDVPLDICSACGSHYRGGFTCHTPESDAWKPPEPE